MSDGLADGHHAGCRPSSVMKLAVWPRKSLSHGSGLPLGRASATEMSLGHNVSSAEEVDAVMEQAAEAGATVVRAAQETFCGGYAGYFPDPDGHLGKVVFNPKMLPSD